MRWLKRIGVSLVVFLVLVVAGLWLVLPRLNGYRVSGDVDLPGLRHPASVLRDAKGMPYVFARDWRDALFLQGFVCAQDRMFQMHLNRLFASGRISELAGERAKNIDLGMRAIGLKRIAQKAFNHLDPADQALLQAYADGVNAFLQTTPEDVPLEFKLAGLEPEPWSPVDSLTILYYMGFVTSANLATEIRAQMVLDKLGPAKAAKLMPLNINPEDPKPPRELGPSGQNGPLGLLGSERLAAWLAPMPLTLGSNNWAIGPALAKRKAPIVAGDPHLDTRMLPGVWHSVGLLTAENRVVGAVIPGLPGIAVGRTDYVAISMTNSYGDTQDLYIEEVKPDDPAYYKDLDRWVRFKVLTETLKIKDSSAPGGFRREKIQIRFTSRGPVVSGVLPGLSGNRVMSLRWSPAEKFSRTLGLFKVFKAKTVHDVDQALRDLPMLMLNWVFADTAGNIAYRASGAVPLRRGRDGLLPAKPGSERDWVGWLPFEMMPHLLNPAKGWLGTANHKTDPNQPTVYYSSYFAPTYRYARLMELMKMEGPKDLEFCWRAQRDQKNLLAVRLVPLFVAALNQDPELKPLAKALREWDRMDAPEAVGPTVFQFTFTDLARLFYTRALGEKAAKAVLGNWYFWEQRLEHLVISGDSEYFDDPATKDRREGRDDLIRLAARAARQRLVGLLGSDVAKWQWGKVHTIEFVNPIRRQGLGADWLGSGKLAMGGSGETLYRAWYDFDKPVAVTISASLRMVADLSDPDKVVAVLSGGEVARTFHPHQKDQIAPFMSGEKRYWWFSDRAIKKNAVHSLRLTPY